MSMKSSVSLSLTCIAEDLTTEQVSDVYEEIYGKDYSKQQISDLMKDSREEVSVWLTRI